MQYSMSPHDGILFLPTDAALNISSMPYSWQLLLSLYKYIHINKAE